MIVPFAPPGPEGGSLHPSGEEGPRPETRRRGIPRRRVRLSALVRALALGGILAGGGLSVPVEAADPPAPTVLRDLGGANVFTAPPLASEADLRDLFRERRRDILTVLRQAGWEGEAEDLFRAVESGPIRDIDFPVGGRLQWMAFRARGGVDVQRNIEWGGERPIDAFQLDFPSADARWTFVVPKICGNVALVSRRGNCELSVRLGTGSLTLRDADGREIVTEAGGVGRISAECPDPDLPQGPRERSETNLVVEEGTVEFIDPALPIMVVVKEDFAVRARLDDSGQLQVETSADSPGPLPIRIGDAVGTISPGATLFSDWSEPTCGLRISEGEALAGGEILLDASGSQISHGVVETVELEILQPDGSRLSLRTDRSSNHQIRQRFTLPGEYSVQAVAVSDRGKRSSDPCTATFRLGAPTRIVKGSFTAEWRSGSVDRRSGSAWSSVTLQYAPEVQEEAVVVSWSATAVGEPVRFNLHRVTEDGRMVQVNTQPIAPADREGETVTYRFEDLYAPPGRTRYRLESIDAQGATVAIGAFADVVIPGPAGSR